MNQLTKHKISRTALHSHCNRIEKEIQALVVDFKATDVVKLKSLKLNYEKQIDKITLADEKVLELTQDDQYETEIEKTLLGNDKFYETIALIDSNLEIFANANGTPATPIGTVRSPTLSGRPEVRVRLPKIELCKFDGNLLNWTTFWDQFNSSVHSQPRLNPVDKFSYLKGLLSPQAAECIAGLSLTDGNYVQAVTLLTERYGNKQLLVNANMDAFMKLPRVRLKTHVKELRALYDQLETTIRNLKSLNVEINDYGSLLVPILTEKLPSEIKVEISRSFKGELWRLDQVIEIFKNELQAMEHCASNPSARRASEEEKSDPFSTSNLYGHLEKPPQSNRYKCIFCNGSHYPSQCTNVTDVKARVTLLRKKGRCFLCFSSGHVASNCTSEYICKKCNRRHNIAICGEKFKGSKNTGGDEKFKGGKDSAGDGETRDTSNTHAGADVDTGGNNGILLQTGYAKVLNAENDSHNSDARLLFDGGSQRSYITETLRDTLLLRAVRTERLIIKTFGVNDSKMKNIEVVQIKVRKSSPAHHRQFVNLEALVVPEICSPLSDQRPKLVKFQYPHLRKLYISDFVNCTDGNGMDIDILIGADFYFSFMTGKIVRGDSINDPVALESTLGWILTGSYPRVSVPRDLSNNLCTTHAIKVAVDSDPLNDTLKRFWEVESVGNDGENSVMEEFVKNIKFNGERYVTELPFKPDREFLPDNYRTSLHRLTGLTNRLEKDPKLFEEYDRILKDYENCGIIERVSPEEESEPGKVHYNPHRAVLREEKTTTKVRPVFDCSCNSTGPSLNDCLYAGPNLLAKIFDILLRLRLHKIVVTSDIKQAFLNVAVADEHKDYLRFLWYNNIEERELIIYRFNMVLFGAKPSPFLLQGTIRHHCDVMCAKNEFTTKFIEQVLRNLYVDDCHGGVDSVEDGLDFYKKAKRLMETAGFQLRKWSTNNESLQKLFDVEEGVKIDPKPRVIANECCEDDSSFLNYQFGFREYEGILHSILGVQWDIRDDNFVFSFDQIIEKAEKLSVSKRNILKISSSFFDPLGLISPVVIQAKVIFQELCKEKFDWDKAVPEITVQTWKKFVTFLKSFNVIRIPRFIFSSVDENLKSLEIHGFCDSSKVAYCAAVFVRKETEKGVTVNLLTAKTKVAPLNTLTIPRLELLSCFLLANLIVSVTLALQTVAFTDTYCWSDSKVALHWIKGVTRDRKPWVENRVSKIREFVEPNRWRHVPGNMNPADIPTRNVTNNDLGVDSVWFCGPLFLYTAQESWPVNNFNELEINSQEAQLPSETKSVNRSVVMHHSVKTNCSNLDDICIEKYSKLHYLLCVVAYVLRFKVNLMSCLKQRIIENCRRSGELTVSELHVAEIFILKHEQKMISDDKKFELQQKSLDLFYDENGVIRLKGRLGNAELVYDRKCPMLLKDGHFCSLVIMSCHEEVKHGGTEATLNKLRERFWVVRGRQVIKKILQRCVTCRRHQARPLLPPSSPDLPNYRVAADFCFQSVGTDFAGPLLVKSIYKGDGGMHEAYICLFTCATSRAVHLELVPDLQSATFIRALKRFIGRRGYPKLLVSDNAKTFTSVMLHKFLVKNSIEKTFILPSSPWWGGFYERLVRSIKLPLKKTLGKAKLTYEETETVLVEVEGIINSRPLTYLYDDDVVEALTPSHLLVGRNMYIRADNEKQLSVVVDVSAESLNNRAKYLQNVLVAYWNRFSTRYLSELREHHIHRNRRSKIDEVNVLKVGDIVVIKEEKNSPRCSWRLGRIERLVVGGDRKVRGAVIFSISPTGKRTRSTKPIQKIIPLEMPTAPNTNEISVRTNVSDDNVVNSSLADEMHSASAPTDTSVRPNVVDDIADVSTNKKSDRNPPRKSRRLAEKFVKLQ